MKRLQIQKTSKQHFAGLTNLRKNNPTPLQWEMMDCITTGDIATDDWRANKHIVVSMWGDIRIKGLRFTNQYTDEDGRAVHRAHFKNEDISQAYMLLYKVHKELGYINDNLGLEVNFKSLGIYDIINKIKVEAFVDGEQISANRRSLLEHTIGYNRSSVGQHRKYIELHNGWIASLSLEIECVEVELYRGENIDYLNINRAEVEELQKKGEFKKLTFDLSQEDMVYENARDNIEYLVDIAKAIRFITTANVTLHSETLKF